MVEPPECDDTRACAGGFLLDRKYFQIGCTAIRESAVTTEVIGEGILYGQEISVNVIAGVDAGIMVAVSRPGGDCSENDPDEHSSAWSMAFPAAVGNRELSEAICAAGEMSASQRLANRCHLNGELLACDTGPSFPPEILEDLSVYPEPTGYFGADLEALLGTDDPGDLTGWHVILDERTADNDYVQLLLRRELTSGKIQYVLDGSDEVFKEPRVCNPASVQ